MESRPTVPDRKLLARLVLIREEARDMMGGGLLDERNDCGLSKLPETEETHKVQKMISDVMNGKNEGADNIENGEEEPNGSQSTLGGIAGRGSISRRKPRPVRPGMFLETVSKVLGGIYAGNISGMAAQHLKWVNQKTLQILQQMSFSSHGTSQLADN